MSYFRRCRKRVTSSPSRPTAPAIHEPVPVLQPLGAGITAQTDRTIRLEGVPELGGYNHVALNDPNESASWASAALVTNGDIFVEGATQRDLTAFLNVYRKI